MARKYSDAIRIRETKSAYNIQKNSAYLVYCFYFIPLKRYGF